MKCPVCNVDLAMAERQSVEINYCPQCRGVWLDPGKLDKIIDRCLANVPAPSHVVPAAQPASSHQSPQYDYPRDHQERHSYDKHHHDRHKDHDSHHDGHHRPKSFFEKLFD